MSPITQQFIATLVGAFVGFVGSLILFWVKEGLTKKAQDKSLRKNLIYELSYNIDLFERYEVGITRSIEIVNSGSLLVPHLSLDYQQIAHYFAHQFYQAGLLQKYFEIADMRRWNDYMLQLQPGSQVYVQTCLRELRQGKLEKEDAIAALTAEMGYVTEARKTSDYIRTRIGG